MTHVHYETYIEELTVLMAREWPSIQGSSRTRAAPALSSIRMRAGFNHNLDDFKSDEVSDLRGSAFSSISEPYHNHIAPPKLTHSPASPQISSATDQCAQSKNSALSFAPPPLRQCVPPRTTLRFLRAESVTTSVTTSADLLRVMDCCDRNDPTSRDYDPAV